MRKISLLILFFYVLGLFGCVKKGKKKEFLCLGEIKEDKTMRIKYNEFTKNDSNIYLSFEIDVYDSTIKTIREFTLSGNAKINKVLINSVEIEKEKDFELTSSNNVELLLSVESMNEYLNIYIYQHEMITLYLSEKTVNGNGRTTNQIKSSTN